MSIKNFKISFKKKNRKRAWIVEGFPAMPALNYDVNEKRPCVEGVYHRIQVTPTHREDLENHLETQE